MDLRESAEQRALRQELREYFAALLPDEERRTVAEQGAGGPRFREVVRMLGRDGWLGVGWPVEYGGRGLTAEEQFIFYDEVQRAGVPFPLVTINTVGPTLMAFGTEEQKERYLPGMLRGEIIFAIGYTEPGAGTDLASLQTRAVADGDDFVVDGAKIFTTGGNTADFVWLACRTDPEAPKHRGISILIVPCDDPGFSWSPIQTVGGMSVTATYYSGIRVPAGSVVGEVNGGWQLITAQLNHERVALAALGGRTIQLWEQVREWAVETGAIGTPWVQRELARTYARLEAMRLLNWKMTADVARDRLTGATAGAVKTYGTETHIDVQRALAQILGAGGRARPGTAAAALEGQVEQLTRQSIVNTFGGGVNEVLRDMVATQALGLPRGEAMSMTVTDLDKQLEEFVGRVLVERAPGPDPVSVPMIRQWVEALELDPEVHLDPAVAQATGRPDVVAPAAMTQAWVMRGYAATVRPQEGTGSPVYDELVGLLADAGFGSVVATDSDFEFHRELVPGTLVGYTEAVESISPQKETALGVGHFVTTLKTYRDQDGEVVATQRWRTLRFRPRERSGAGDAPRPLRPRPAVNRDNAFWFEAAREHRLVIQRCTDCQTLRHPPGPGCAACGSFAWDTVTASGQATLYSWVLAHHPKHPAFDYPLVIALVELAEGTRLTTNLVDVDPDDLEVGMPLELTWLEADPELTLPVFRPASHRRND